MYIILYGSGAYIYTYLCIYWRENMSWCRGVDDKFITREGGGGGGRCERARKL